VEGHHVRKEGIAREAGGLQLKSRQPVGHRQLRRDRCRQLRGNVAPPGSSAGTPKSK
jgi:hypothetical protein